MRHAQKVLRVLRVFVDHPDQRLYALDIGRMAGLKTGSIYPALVELEVAGWVLSDWDPQPVGPHMPGIRRRRYRLNPNRPAEERIS